MKTVTHEEYLALNQVQRNSTLEKSKIPLFEVLCDKFWIELAPEPMFWHSKTAEYRLTSAGRLEHNLYEKIEHYSDGYKKKRQGCPACGNNDPHCRVCCGYKA